MLTVETLRAYGADTEDGLKRCMNIETFYLGLVQSVLEDNQLESLGHALASHDLDAAFEHAHALKGIYANLSLTPLLKPIQEMTELLRSRTNTDYTALFDEAASQLKKLKAIAQE